MEETASSNGNLQPGMAFIVDDGHSSDDDWGPWTATGPRFNAQEAQEVAPAPVAATKSTHSDDSEPELGLGGNPQSG